MQCLQTYKAVKLNAPLVSLIPLARLFGPSIPDQLNACSFPLPSHC
jgi:hypothetical protein